MVEVSVDDVICLAAVTAETLGRQRISLAYIGGGEGIRVELGEAGVQVVDERASTVHAVVVGMDRTLVQNLSEP